jgi:hypothetical protein
MTAVQNKNNSAIKNDNLKNLKPMRGAASTSTPEGKSEINESEKSTISNTAKNLSNQTKEDGTKKVENAIDSASSVAKSLAKVPVLPIVVPSEAKQSDKLAEKLSDHKLQEKTKIIKKPAVIFIEGFSAFGISNGDGIKDMADNLPGAKRFSWDEKDKIIDEIKKHSPEQPVILVGHSFGADSAVEIANTLNSLQNGFRNIDLLVSIDSVGINHSIIPMNVRRNLNFFGEGFVPFLHGDPTVARNTDYTEVVNELRSELHSRMDDSQEIQYKIFDTINDVLGEFDQPDIFEEIQQNSLIKDLIHNR